MKKLSLKKLSFLLLLSSLLLTATGCCKKDGGGSPEGATSGESAGKGGKVTHDPVAAAKIAIPDTGSSFTPPSGWEQSQKGDWTIVHVPADANGNIEALMAFVTFNKPNESTRKLGALASVFGLNSINWSGREFLELPSGFPATGASSACKDGTGRPCEVHYLTINPGGSEQILFIYLVDSDVADKHKNTMIASLKSLKKD